MLQIQGLTDYASQSQSITLFDGTIINFTLSYIPQQYGWFFSSLNYGSLNINGLRICNNPNMLRQWENLIEFGIACYTSGNREPTQQGDFLSGASALYILTSAEVQAYSEFLSNG
jgi:hypothetical protein